MSNDTILTCIDDLAVSMKQLLISKIRKSPYVAIQMNESTDISKLSQLSAFLIYIHEEKIDEDFLFANGLKQAPNLEMLYNLFPRFFEEHNSK